MNEKGLCYHGNDIFFLIILFLWQSALTKNLSQSMRNTRHRNKGKRKLSCAFAEDEPQSTSSMSLIVDGGNHSQGANTLTDDEFKIHVKSLEEEFNKGIFLTYFLIIDSKYSDTNIYISTYKSD